MPRPKKGDAALRRIKAYIQEKGWTQHRAVDPYTHAVCLSQACQVAGDPSSTARIRRAVRAVRAVRTDCAITTIPIWNDCNGRTVEDVYALIDRTIKEG